MKQPNLGYADVKLDFACMHPAGSACRVSLCVYYDLCGGDQKKKKPQRPKSFESIIQNLASVKVFFDIFILFLLFFAAYKFF